MLQIGVVKKNDGACNFCTERDNKNRVELYSTHPHRSIRVRVCSDCFQRLINAVTGKKDLVHIGFLFWTPKVGDLVINSRTTCDINNIVQCITNVSKDGLCFSTSTDKVCNNHIDDYKLYKP